MDGKTVIGSSRENVTWLLIAGLLILRLPFLTGVIMISKVDPPWLEPIYQIGTYLLTAGLIWLERNYLALFHIDCMVIAIFMLFKPLETILLPIMGVESPLSFPNPLSFIFFIISICLFLSLWRSNYKISKNFGKSAAWLITGSVFGVIVLISFTVIMVDFLKFPIPHPVGVVALSYPIYQLGYAAVDEEPLFRGFLWGALKNVGIKDPWILIIQALLFTSGHSFFLQSANAVINLAFVFIFGLLLGFLVWKSRTIASTLGFHAFYNGAEFIDHAIISIIFKY